jgi:ATPase family AAA domain-containing protein 3A/B
VAVSAEVEVAKIHEKRRLGVFDQKEKSRIQASVDAEKTRWSEVKNMVSDPFFVAKVVLGVAAIAVGFYGVRYALRYLYEHFTLPRVISQTSRPGWFGNKVDMQSEAIDDLVFEPRVHKQLFELSLRVKAAKEFGENLPNVLFYGPSGTGKTAFAKALAYWSGLDYAITSGSEFAKITDLNLASGELRKLLDWSKNSDKGLIIFIDEAESLFADRNLATTPKIVHDFINTFLSLISDQSQKGLMFIFATNHPFKIDEAILNRIGTMVEFLLPQKPEQAKIFCEHLERYSHEPEKVPVDFDEQTMSALLDYGAKSLEGLSPREIKFLAQEIVIYARQQAANALSKETIQGVIDTVHRRQLQTKNWKNQRDEWLRKASAAAAA